jgi:hypothetical protein
MSEKRGRGRPKGSKNKVQKNITEPNNEGETNLRIPKTKAIAKPPKPPKQELTYNYTELAKISLGNTELLNVYAVVICAGSPHEKNNKNSVIYRQLVKLVDITQCIKHPREAYDLNNGCTPLTFFAKTPEELP